MRFSVSQSSLAQAITIVLKGVTTISTAPVLSGILFTAKEGSVTLQTTNIKVAIKHTIEAAVDEEGSCVVSGAFVAKLIKNLPNAPVVFESNDAQTQISCLKSVYQLAILNSSDFPEFPQLQESQTIELPSELLSQMVERLYRVTKQDVSNPILEGITLVAQENKLSMFATDSHRLAIVDTHTDFASPKEEFTCIIPASCFHEILNLPNISETLHIGLSDNQVIFKFQNTTYISRKIEGSFPAYQNLFPKVCNTKISVNPELLSESIRRVALVTTNNNLGVHFDIKPDAQTITLHANSNEIGVSQEDLPAKIEGNPISFAMNYQYILECAKSTTNSDELAFEVVDSFQPITIKSFGTFNYQCLLIPLRTN